MNRNLSLCSATPDSSAFSKWWNYIHVFLSSTYCWHYLQASMVSMLCAVPDHGTKPPLDLYGSADASFHMYTCKK